MTDTDEFLPEASYYYELMTLKTIQIKYKMLTFAS